MQVVNTHHKTYLFGIEAFYVIDPKIFLGMVNYYTF